jgi:hypothetical protein
MIAHRVSFDSMSSPWGMNGISISTTAGADATSRLARRTAQQASPNLGGSQSRRQTSRNDGQSGSFSAFGKPSGMALTLPPECPHS